MARDTKEPGSLEAKEARPARRRAGVDWRLRAKDLPRFAGHAALLAIIVLGAWAARLGFVALPQDAVGPAEGPAEAAVVEEAPQVVLSIADLPSYPVDAPIAAGGITRRADMQTIIPDRPRVEVIKYVVQEGDTLFGIAEKFGLKPSTILWGNWETLEGDPHTLRPGQELNILPVDGTYYEWHEGDGLSGVAKFFGVTPQDIIDWPGNELDPDLDPADPDIEPGTWLIIPGGRRELPTWRSPRITRSNPAAAKILGPGYCGTIVDGPTGTNTFVWPTSSQWISGFSYDPELHPAIDIGGAMGNGIFASDTGVVVYSGWNNWGYGYVIVIDHGTGWQTLYAHLSQINVGCGQAIFQGQLIGLMGSSGNSSGPHLHFEMMSDIWGKVNPLNFLP